MIWAIVCILMPYLNWVFMASKSFRFLPSLRLSISHTLDHPRNNMQATKTPQNATRSPPMKLPQKIYDSNTETSTAITPTHNIPAPILPAELSANPQHVALYVTLFHFAATSNTLPFPTL